MPDKWAVYAGPDGITHYVSLRDVIGVKYPDGPDNNVTLRMSNGHFVNTVEPLSKVLIDLANIS